LDVGRYSSVSIATGYGGEWSAARPGRRGTHFTGGWEGPRAGIDWRQISSAP